MLAVEGTDGERVAFGLRKGSADQCTDLAKHLRKPEAWLRVGALAATPQIDQFLQLARATRLNPRFQIGQRLLGEEGQLDLATIVRNEDRPACVHRVMAKSAALSCECRGHAEAAARQACLAGLGIAFRLRLDEERALEVLPAHASVREAAVQALLGRGPDRPVDVAAVDHREHRVEELLEVLEVDDRPLAADHRGVPFFGRGGQAVTIWGAAQHSAKTLARLRGAGAIK